MSDMSCQQAPSSKNTDDPYIFTESPISTSVYSSQLGRQTPLKSTQLYQSQQNLSNTPHQKQRFNGNIQLVNGYHNPAVNIQPKTASSTIIQPPPLANQQKSLVKQKSITTIVQPQQQNYLKPPPPLYHNFHNYLINHSTDSVSTGQKSAVQTYIQSSKKSVGGGKSINTNELKTQILNTKCDIIRAGDNSGNSSIHNENGILFSVPKVTGTKKIFGNRYIKRSGSQISQYDSQRISSSLSNISQFNTTISKEWHSPETFIFDYTGPGATRPEALELSSCNQNCWFSDYLEENEILSREQRLEFKKSSLRRQAIQYSNSQKLRNNAEAKRRLFSVIKTYKLSKLKEESPLQQKCCIENCSNDSLALTAYCYLHITHNADQLLFHPCTAKFSDNSQCRVPVFDISHELPLCTEHAWKRDNYDRILQEQKPKKPPRKKPKPSAMTRPPKRNKKKKKLLANKQNIQQISQPVQTFIHRNQTIVANDSYIHFPQAINTMSIPNPHRIQNISANTQEFLNVCENSSAYESSEDTGVGGLSESELIHSDAIEENPLGDTRLLEEHDLTNVLNQIPEETFKEFLSVEQNSPFEPTQEEKEDLERALEAVDEQVKSLQQITGSDFLGDFLDVDDQMLDDADICSEVLQSTNTASEIRSGLVHT